MATSAMTLTEICEAHAIKPSTFRAYVARGQAPKPSGFDPDTGLRLWDRAALQTWPTPGPGAALAPIYDPPPDPHRRALDLSSPRQEHARHDRHPDPPPGRRGRRRGILRPVRPRPR